MYTIKFILENYIQKLVTFCEIVKNLEWLSNAGRIIIPNLRRVTASQI